jgi:RNA polymerase sigma factor (sigma-70 family)
MTSTHYGDSVSLIRRAKAGDALALSDLFERFRPYVYKVVALHLGKPVDALDDLVQETLLRAFSGFESFRTDEGLEREQLRAWLATCARTAVIDNHRRWKATKRGGGTKAVRFEDQDLHVAEAIFSSDDPTASQLAMLEEAEGSSSGPCSPSRNATAT